jgi:predicted thioesterase
MDFNIKKGIQGNQTKIVETKDVANQYGSGTLEVFATPAMIALMEITAFISIESILPKGYSSVGIEINVQHTKASLPGAIITCKSELVSINDKKVSFNILAFDESGLIGKAEHVRYIINAAEFMNKLHK